MLVTIKVRRHAMKKARIAIVLLLGSMLISGIACGRGGEPSPTSTPRTYEWTLTQLTFSKGQAAWPSISADGTRIAFLSMVDDDDSEIFIMDSDGIGLTQITSNAVEGYMPSMSADGTKIAFMSWVDDDVTEIFIVNSDGSGLTQITSNTVGAGILSISADGTRIALELSADNVQQIFLLELVS
jgi:Tol biopolymer transport system component